MLCFKLHPDYIKFKEISFLKHLQIKNFGRTKNDQCNDKKIFELNHIFKYINTLYNQNWQTPMISKAKR
jgi:hypothetical protein